jgi:hypothetical protein
MFLALSDICIKGILTSVPRSCNFARLIVGSVLARVNTVHKEVREAAAIALAQVTINSCSDSLKSDRVEGASAAVHIAVRS